MMLQNHDASNWRFVTVVWADNVTALEVDQDDGVARPAVDAAPHVDGFQVQLDAGAARLYLIENKGKRADEEIAVAAQV